MKKQEVDQENKQSRFQKFLSQLTHEMLTQMKLYLKIQKFQFQTRTIIFNRISLYEDISAIVACKDSQNEIKTNKGKYREIVNELALKTKRSYITLNQRLKKKLAKMTMDQFRYILQTKTQIHFIGKSLNTDGWPLHLKNLRDDDSSSVSKSEIISISSTSHHQVSKQEQNQRQVKRYKSEKPTKRKAAHQNVEKMIIQQPDKVQSLKYQVKQTKQAELFSFGIKNTKPLIIQIKPQIIYIQKEPQQKQYKRQIIQLDEQKQQKIAHQQQKLHKNAQKNIIGPDLRKRQKNQIYDRDVQKDIIQVNLTERQVNLTEKQIQKQAKIRQRKRINAKIIYNSNILRYFCINAQTAKKSYDKLKQKQLIQKIKLRHKMEQQARYKKMLQQIQQKQKLQQLNKQQKRLRQYNNSIQVQDEDNTIAIRRIYIQPLLNTQQQKQNQNQKEKDFLFIDEEHQKVEYINNYSSEKKNKQKQKLMRQHLSERKVVKTDQIKAVKVQHVKKLVEAFQKLASQLSNSNLQNEARELLQKGLEVSTQINKLTKKESYPQTKIIQLEQEYEQDQDHNKLQQQYMRHMFELEELELLQKERQQRENRQLQIDIMNSEQLKRQEIQQQEQEQYNQHHLQEHQHQLNQFEVEPTQYIDIQVEEQSIQHIQHIQDQDGIPQPQQIEVNSTQKHASERQSDQQEQQEKYYESGDKYRYESSEKQEPERMQIQDEAYQTPYKTNMSQGSSYRSVTPKATSISSSFSPLSSGRPPISSMQYWFSNNLPMYQKYKDDPFKYTSIMWSQTEDDLLQAINNDQSLLKLQTQMFNNMVRAKTSKVIRERLMFLRIRISYHLNIYLRNRDVGTQ